MATKRKTRLKGISGIAAASTCIQKIPIGPRYHRLLVAAKATAKTFAQIVAEMRVMVNGHVQQIFTPAELNRINSRNGDDYKFTDSGAGELSIMTIFFAEPWRKKPETGDGYAWRTRGLDTFTLEIDLQAGIPADTELYVIAEADESILRDDSGKEAANQLPSIRLIERKFVPFIGTKVTDFDLESGYLYQVLEFNDPHIESIKLQLDKSIWYDLTKQEADTFMKQHGLVPSEDVFAIVLDEDDVIGSALPVARGNVVEFEIRVAEQSEDDETTEFPRNVTVMVEKYGAPV